MKYKIGEKVRFNHDYYDIWNNTELVYEGTVQFKGIINSVIEEENIYLIDAQNGINYKVDEKDIIASEREDKIKELEQKITEQKFKIADCSIQMRNALWNDHPTALEESRKEYNKLHEEWFDLISEYDDLEDKYIILTEKQ